MLLRERWFLTLESQGLEQESVGKVYEVLLKYYGKKYRAYHNLSHIEAMLNLLDEYQMNISEPEMLSLAIWFHDVIYQPLKKNNESKSARLAQKYLFDLGLPKDQIERVSVLILQTATPTAKLVQKDRDMAWFLDFDLAILGRDPEVYAYYADAVRKEFRMVPEAMYRIGRMKVLRQFLETDFIYRTASMRKRFERQSRKNLLKELKFWEANL